MPRNKERLVKILQKMQSDGKTIIESSQELDDSQRSREPSPGAWSIDEILWHVYVSERMSIQYMTKKMAYPDQLLPAGFSARKNSMLLKTFLRSPAKAKVPNSIADIPLEFMGDELIAEWKALRDKLATIIDNTEIDILNRLVYRHPVVGRMDMKGALTFFYEHQRRHGKQIARAIQSVAK